MTSRAEVLRQVMLETGLTQSRLARMSGIRQPSISRFLSGDLGLSDEQLDRLLSCMGYQLRVDRYAIAPRLTRSERRSWQLHRQLATHLDRAALESWRPIIERNLARLRDSVRGEPHETNLERWSDMLRAGDLPGIHRTLTGLDRSAIEMREVSPMSGLLPDHERHQVLREAG